MRVRVCADFLSSDTAHAEGRHSPVGRVAPQTPLVFRAVLLPGGAGWRKCGCFALRRPFRCQVGVSSRRLQQEGGGLCREGPGVLGSWGPGVLGSRSRPRLTVGLQGSA